MKLRPFTSIMSQSLLAPMLLTLWSAGCSDGGESMNTPDASDGTPTLIAATFGNRCLETERTGVVEIRGAFPNRVVVARLFDRPNPLAGAADLTDEFCTFYKFSPSGPCLPCAETEMCGSDGSCVPAPITLKQAQLTMSGDGMDQVFTAGGDFGFLEGEISLASETLSAELLVSGLRITVSETATPPPMENFSGIVTGIENAPTALDLSWDGVSSDAEIYTNIPVNHHAAQGTFTECQIAPSAGGLHIDGEMLAPLAIETGLEFQGIEHVRFAVAKTSDACIEFRFSSRKQHL